MHNNSNSNLSNENKKNSLSTLNLSFDKDVDSPHLRRAKSGSVALINRKSSLDYNVRRKNNKRRSSMTTTSYRQRRYAKEPIERRISLLSESFNDYVLQRFDSTINNTSDINRTSRR